MTLPDGRDPNDPTNICLNLRNVPRHLRDAYKAYCARRRTNMTADLTKYIKTCVAKDAKPRRRK